jgi:Lipase (class 3)
MIRQILQHFQDHGIVDVMKKYPTKTVVLAIVALSKLQRAASVLEEGSEVPQLQIDRDLIRRLAHYSVYASAAYGWTMEAALRGRLHMGNLQALLKTTGIEPEDVIKSAWVSKTHRPAFFIVRDKKYRKIVLAIRGTLSPRDLLTDLCAVAETFETDCPGNHRAHQGMLKAARCVAKETADIIDAELRANPDFSLVLVGHSLGGGVASVLGTLWEGKYPDLTVFSYGSPCVGPTNARPTTCQNIFSIIAEGDPFSCLSLGHIANLSRAIAILCEDDELRNLINLQTDRSPDRMDINDLQWCSDTMKNLRSNLTNECLFPPGRTIIIKREYDSSVSMYEAPLSKFTELRLHGRMLDISRHVPSLYESLLKDYLSQ